MRKGPTRQTLLEETFVQLADSLVTEFDIVDLLAVLVDRCSQLLDTGAAAILLADQQEHLQVVAASSGQARLLELFELQNSEGPCLDCFFTGAPVVNSDLSAMRRWPRLSEKALAAGFNSVQAVPLRLRDVVIGTLNIFMSDMARITGDDIQMAQALADMATIAILQHHHLAEEVSVVVGHLQRTLNSRFIVEQAKGILAQYGQIDLGEAFTSLWDYTRRHDLQLGAVAAKVVAGQMPSWAIIESSRPGFRGNPMGS
jgi:GAF domain-containing protein